ncbi:MAG: hypothetical protein K2P17_08240 [Helicobacteraceae bacterium]|nr:hypothetical protein [Helicobacteraceae bacterium]
MCSTRCRIQARVDKNIKIFIKGNPNSVYYIKKR